MRGAFDFAMDSCRRMPAALKLACAFGLVALDVLWAVWKEGRAR